MFNVAYVEVENCSFNWCCNLPKVFSITSSTISFRHCSFEGTETANTIFVLTDSKSRYVFSCMTRLALRTAPSLLPVTEFAATPPFLSNPADSSISKTPAFISTFPQPSTLSASSSSPTRQSRAVGSAYTSKAISIISWGSISPCFARISVFACWAPSLSTTAKSRIARRSEFTRKRKWRGNLE